MSTAHHKVVNIDATRRRPTSAPPAPTPGKLESNLASQRSALLSSMLKLRDLQLLDLLEDILADGVSPELFCKAKRLKALTEQRLR